MLRRVSFGLFLVFLILSLVTGCVRKSGEKMSGRLTLDFNSEPVTLDPSRVEDGLGIRLIANLMDGLMGLIVGESSSSD